MHRLNGQPAIVSQGEACGRSDRTERPLHSRPMKFVDFSAERLDVAAFAAAGTALDGVAHLEQFGRLGPTLAALPEGTSADVQWSARAELRPVRHGKKQVWMQVRARARLPLECQRCLDAVVETVEVDRWFRFVDSETEAEALDADSEEDVLVLSRSMNLLELIEDELLLAMPLVPMHEDCDHQPVSDWVTASDLLEDTPAEPERPNPFAVLAGLGRKPSDP